MAIKVQFDPRFKRRKVGNAIGKSLLKTLAEPVTNSDDSYRRQEEQGLLDKDTVKPIIIEIDRTDKARRSVRVVDFGEGMTDKSMEKLFSFYGKDTSGGSGGVGVRGVFGQGISDVLFYHKNGQILSIVDRVLYACKFKGATTGDWEIDPKRTSTHLNDQVRRRLGIPEGNGTVVKFEVSSSTPTTRKLPEVLSNFYMLRLINSSPSRKVTLREITKNNTSETVLQYSFPEGTVIDSWDEQFDYEGYPIRASIVLKKAREALASRQNGLLVFDEKQAVYDLTLFGYDLNQPGAELLYGTVELEGVRELIYNRMNQEQPEEILTDERDGFNMQHDFYKTLQGIIKPRLDKILISEVPGKPVEKEESSPKHKKVFALFDDLYKKVMGAEHLVINPKVNLAPPEDGLQFDRNRINVTVGKSYSIGLNINLSLVPIGSTVTLMNDKDGVSIEPHAFEVTEDLRKLDMLARKTIMIKGQQQGIVSKVAASSDSYTGLLIATVVDQDRVYPEFMDFYPSDINVTQNGHHVANLYINTQQVIPGSTVDLSVDNEKLTLSEESFEIPAKCEYDDIVKYEVAFGVTEKCVATLMAFSLDAGEQALAHVRVIDPKEPKPTRSTSKFKDWIFYPNLGNNQCIYIAEPTDSNYGMLLVNSTHPLNQRYFGTNPSKATVDKSLISQAYLAEILTNEILNFIFTEKQREEQASGGDPNAQKDPHNYIRREIARMKMSIGLEAQKLWVNQDRLDAELQKLD